MKAPVHLICACNSSYILPLSVMLVSAVEHFDPERQLVIHIISNDASAVDQASVQDSIEIVRPGLDHIEVHWYAIHAGLLEKLAKPKDYLSRDTYARLFAPDLLPESCERAIYLDCDMVILADLAKLYDSTLEHPALLHATHDIFVPLVSSESGVFDYVERGIPATARYFNCGVLVINLKLWREKNLTVKLLEYLEQHGERIHLVDQGALNALLFDDWAPLDIRWNQPHAVLYPRCWGVAGYTEQEWLRAKNDPYIVHYTGPHKPWLKTWRLLPRRIYFYRYLRKTVFRKKLRGYPYLESLLGVRAYYDLYRMKRRIFPTGLKNAFQPGVTRLRCA